MFSILKRKNASTCTIYIYNKYSLRSAIKFSALAMGKGYDV